MNSKKQEINDFEKEKLAREDARKIREKRLEIIRKQRQQEAEEEERKKKLKKKPESAKKASKPVKAKAAEAPN